MKKKGVKNGVKILRLRIFLFRVVCGMRKLKFQACLSSVSEGVSFRFCSNIVELEVEKIITRKTIPIRILKKECATTKRCCNQKVVALILMLFCF